MNVLCARMLRLLVVLIVLSPSVLFAQWGIPDIGDIVDELPGLEDLIAGIPGLGGGEYEPALTTSLADAVTEVPFLDDYGPDGFVRLRPMPGWPDNGYYDGPGRYEGDIESFCLHAGTYGPSEGDGYLYAPLKGPRASVIEHILVNSAYFPEIPQHDIQVLIWGILARTKISDMNSDLQHAASLLLTSDEMYDLNGGALGLIPDEMWDEVFDRVDVSPSVRRYIEAEGRLRSSLTAGGYTYDELERIAVLPGSPPASERTRIVPAGRWSYHPRGFFVRYEPHGYPRTHVQVSIPNVLTVERDDVGRIVAVADKNGKRVEAVYDDSVEPLRFSGDTDAAGYAFDTIRFVTCDEGGDDPVEWQASHGWALTGVPGRAGGDVEGRYPDVEERVAWALEHKSQVESLCALMPSSRFREALSVNAIQIGLFTDAVQESFGGRSAGHESNRKAAVELLKEAWQYAICLAMMDLGGERSIAKAKGGKGGGGGSGEEMGMDLSGDSATPAGGSQRLGQGGRESEPMSPDMLQLMYEAFEYAEGYEKGYREGHENGFNHGMKNVPDDPDDIPLEPLAPADAPDRSAGSDPFWQGYCDGYETGWWDGYHSGYDWIYDMAFGD